VPSPDLRHFTLSLLARSPYVGSYQSHKAASQKVLVTLLNPRIRGWARYYRTVVAKRTFALCDYHLMSTLRHWAGRRHSSKTLRWVYRKYWRRGPSGRVEFSTPTGLRLVHHADVPIRRHVKVRGTVSAFNGDVVYWCQRLRQHPLTSDRMAILLKRQQGRCTWCGLLFTDRTDIEVDHLLPRVFGGTADLANLQLLHRICHDQKSAQDGSITHRSPHGVQDKNRLTEEPDEGKLSRPVLKTSRSGD
jgi:RNA-directed DNA polymerase